MPNERRAHTPVYSKKTESEKRAQALNDEAGPLENGDPVEYRYTTEPAGEWVPAKYYSEDRLSWFLLDTDEALRDYLKDRVEVRRRAAQGITVIDPASEYPGN